uniref:Uncharacterized protein n=1 Tax=Chromera velia CCMP2878 TaxID=1169474 RepID=A0A0G4GSV5_9ALVE|eukprot:Cvel_23240.t1-p1 / transcript=Cvel_23240.t1 / gene=Cvel_23240 / organism=Chromera_velia_CCMP2878 / gene_product=hypothetical protein / transcript_product=hypothetical protein / location=Cvel_scaffold2373:25615-26406(-) / protein_length=264 / sequence_SO=supercontig / SO=protein_coding / is_pseudo=false
MLKSILSTAVSFGAVCALGSPAEVFSDSAIFEGLSHFKDFGVPGTVEDPVNQAMIADGSCRLLNAASGDETAFAFWYNQESTKEVISALAGLPSTSKPSNFTLSAKRDLGPLCKRLQKKAVSETDFSCRRGYDFTTIAQSMSNWHRALCASASESSWEGEFDPAYQPQQVALTAGFMCLISCDSNKKQLPLSALQSFAESVSVVEEVKKNTCTAFPWGQIDFSAVSSADAMGALTYPLLEMCGCARSVGGKGLRGAAPEQSKVW